MPSKATRAASSVLIFGLVAYGCAFGKLGAHDRSQLVQDDVLNILQPVLTEREGVSVADRAAVQAESLRSKGWHVEAADEASHERYEKRYPGRELILDVPKERQRGEEAAWDFGIYSMVDQWIKWTVFIQRAFFSSKPEYENSVRNRYLRLVAPDLNRFYDVITIKSSRSDITLASDPLLRDPRVDALWKIMDPPDPEARTSVFGPVRYVKPVATGKLQVGEYAIMQAYLERFFYSGSFFHAPYGETRVRDTYILAMVSKTEIVIVQTKLRDGVGRETVADDLSEILVGRTVSTKQPK
jgi:hypothetical protein